jgi:signal transduction histidine kinase
MKNRMSAQGGSASGGKTQTDNRILLRTKIFSRIFAVLVFFVGFFAVVGWKFDIETFKRVSSSLPVIAPNTACSFIFVGIFIFLLGRAGKEQKIARATVALFSLLIALLGLATLIEYIFRLNIGIDQLFFSQKMGANIIRMSPQSAFNFLMVGLALFFYALRERKYVLWGQVLIIAAGITAFVSLFGFFYGVAGLYTIAPYKGMAAHTAVAFVAVFLGILMTRPETGFVKIFSGKGLSSMAARRLILALFSILLIETLVVIGGRAGAYELAYESLIHLLIVAGVFVFLIFYSFRSLDRLAEAERTLEHMKEVDKAKTEFVSLASHQLRTPLTSISWFSEMLLKQEVGSLNPKQKEYLSEVFAQNRRMIDLVDDLLNSSRIDMGMLSIELKSVDLRSILDSVLWEIDPLAKEKNIKVENNFPVGLPIIETDPELARIIFQNVISNAIKYTPNEGKVNIDLTQSGSHVDIKVTDTGYGIPEKQQNRIFTKMFRADNIRNKVTDGSGLGLYIVKAVVKELGGKIYFESKEGRGTAFFITLPMRHHK